MGKIKYSSIYKGSLDLTDLHNVIFSCFHKSVDYIIHHACYASLDALYFGTRVPNGISADSR